MMTRFSIVIPCYNVVEFVDECLRSVIRACDAFASSTHESVEIVCVDDGSTDGTGQKIDSIAAADSRIRVIHKMNEGVSVARNLGLDGVCGEYVCFVDGDDSVEADWLLTYEDAIKRTRADIVRIKFGWDASRNGDAIPPGNSVMDVYPENGGFRRYVGDRLKNWAWNQLVETGNVWGCAIKREIAIKARFARGVAYCEDSLYLMQLVGHLNSGVQLLSNRYKYRIRTGSAMRSAFASEERLKYARALMNFALKNRDADAAVVSRAAIGNILAWASRPRDLVFRRELHEVFTQMHRCGIASCEDVSAINRIPYWLYRLFGWIWPIRLKDKVVFAMVQVKRRVSAR